MSNIQIKEENLDEIEENLDEIEDKKQEKKPSLEEILEAVKIHSSHKVVAKVLQCNHKYIVTLMKEYGKRLSKEGLSSKEIVEITGLKWKTYHSAVKDKVIIPLTDLANIAQEISKK
jgi:hypothetical protein